MVDVPAPDDIIVANHADNYVTKNDLKTELRALEERLTETIRDVETKLLSAFYSFAESTQQRLTQSEKISSGINVRLGTLERRVTDLERKVNFPHNQ